MRCVAITARYRKYKIAFFDTVINFKYQHQYELLFRWVDSALMSRYFSREATAQKRAPAAAHISGFPMGVILPARAIKSITWTRSVGLKQPSQQPGVPAPVPRYSVPLGSVVRRVDGPLKIGVALPNHVQHGLQTHKDEVERIRMRSPACRVQQVFCAHVSPCVDFGGVTHLVGEKLGILPAVVVERHPFDETNVKFLVPCEF